MKKIRLLIVFTILLFTLFMFNSNYNVSANESYVKITIDDATYVRTDYGSITYLYEVTVNFTYDNTFYNLLEGEILMYFKLPIDYTLRTPINRNYNSYNIISLEYVGPNNWELRYDIALNQTIRNAYADNLRFVFTDLIDIYIKTEPNEDAYTFQEIDLIYNQNFITINYAKTDNYIYIRFIMQSDFYINNPYLTDIISLYDFSNLMVRLLNFENPETYFEHFGRQYYVIDRQEGRIETELMIRKDYFTFYYEQIAQVSEETFFNRFVQDYLSDVLNYIKYYVRIGNEFYNIGYLDGHADGYDKGYDIGYDDGYDDGHSDGYDDGYEVGHSDGYSEGHSIGKNEGLNEGSSAWGVLFSAMLSTFGAVLSIEIFPNLTIGMIAAVPLILGLLAFIIGVAKGGKKND